MGPFLLLLSVPLLPQNPTAPAPATPVDAAAQPAKAPVETLVPDALESGMVLIARGSPTGHGWRLGDGGVRAPGAQSGATAGAQYGATVGDLPGERGECMTPGGVRVQCRNEGVKLTFASGRELLWAPDGFLHLRDGGVAGPFAGGVELRLQDGSCVRINRGSSRRQSLQAVDVATAAGRAVRLWWQTGPLFEETRSAWNGERLFCLGDGGAVYRALAMGPLVTLERMLAPHDAVSLPAHRLALDVDALVASLQILLESRARIADPSAVADVRLLLSNVDAVWPADGAPPPRTSTSPLRFLLRAGYDVRFDLDGAELHMAMARHEQPPFVEWKLGYGAAVRCLEGAGAPKGNLVTAADCAPELQPRLDRLELPRAEHVLHALTGEPQHQHRGR
jgi:hypothetical protein